MKTLPTGFFLMPFLSLILMDMIAPVMITVYHSLSREENRPFAIDFRGYAIMSGI
jgi:hypothetical protein